MTQSGILKHLAVAASLGLWAMPAMSAQPAPHVIGIGACAPWKGVPPAICAGAVQDVTQALAKRFDVPQSQVHTLVNKDATVDGLLAFFKALPEFTAQDRVLIYVVLHNGPGDGSHVATGKNDIMIFWSEDDPGATEFALFERKWMLASDFADILHQMGAGDVVAMFDACHSGALASDVVHDNAHPDARIATVASAKPDQLANMNKALTGPLFSSLLVQELQHNETPFAQVLTQAVKKTSTQGRKICTERHAFMTKNNGFDVNCNQTPVIQDPNAMLQDY